MSNLKARRNALIDMEVESIRQMEGKKGELANGRALEKGDSLAGTVKSEHHSSYESSELSEEIVVTTDDEEGSVTSQKRFSPSKPTPSGPTALDCCTAATFEKTPTVATPLRGLDSEPNNNGGLANCNLLMNLPQRDVRATIERWQEEVATLAAMGYPEKLLLSMPTSVPLHQPPSSFTRYDKNRIV